jgi:ferredoxin-NADP reductase
MQSHQARTPATVVALRDITPTVREFILRPEGGAAAWQSGAHLAVSISSKEKTLLRHYSLLPCDQAEGYRIAVKLAESSRGGSRAMWDLKVDDRLQISTPIQQFPLDLNAPAYLLVAGGIGITPMVSMAQSLMRRGANVRLVYAARNKQEWAYIEELRELLGERLALIEGAGFHAENAISSLPTGAQAYVCGPSGLLSAMQTAWSHANRPQELLRFESFGGVDPQSAPFEVRLPRHDLRLKVEPSASLLETLEQHRVQAMWGCRRGESKAKQRANLHLRLARTRQHHLGYSLPPRGNPRAV